MKKRIEPEWRLEHDENFIKWVGEVIDNDREYCRYVIVVAQTGTGLKWVKYSPVVGSHDQRLIYSHGNFYGETREEAIAACESAILQLLE